MKRRSMLALAAGVPVAALLPGVGTADPTGMSNDLSQFTDAQRNELHQHAVEVWRSLEAMVDPSSGMIADNIVGDLSTAASYTSPTNLGCQMWSTIAARELGLISRGQARQRIRRTLTALTTLERHRWSGQFYNWYDPATGAKLTEWPEDGSPIHPFLSSVDNGWLAAALMIVANDDPALARPANAILSGMNFKFYYDPYARGADFGAGLCRGGFWPEEPPNGGVEDNYGGKGPDVWYTGHHYGTHNSETRIVSYVGIALGQIPIEHYFAVWRTQEAGCDWSWQEMKPVGDYHDYLGINVFEGAYRYRDIQFVPSWGGSMFEALMPDLVIPETSWAPTSWGRNHPAFVRGQIEHGLHDAGYGHWGFSPSSDPFAGYREYGVDAMGIDTDGYTSDRERTTVDFGFEGCPGREPQPDPTSYGDGVVTPHAVYLALPYAPEESVAQLRRLRQEFDAHGPGGLYDAIAVGSGTVAARYLALDQGMIMGALGNLLGDNIIRRRFTKGAVTRRLKPALRLETFNVPAEQTL